MIDKNKVDMIYNADCFNIFPFIESGIIDLIILDPLYTIELSLVEKLLIESDRLLKKSGSIYLFMDIYQVSECKILLDKYFHFRNRVVWSRRSPGRNTKNFKNNCEDILYYTKSKDQFTFNKQWRKIRGKDVLPYKMDGQPHGWIFNEETGQREGWAEEGNVWYYTRPFWSMKENVDHSMQKPLKLCDRLILSSSNENDIVLDCFCGSGSFVVSAKNNNRRYLGIEKDRKHYDLINRRLKEEQPEEEICDRQLKLM